jgi:signal peptidase I
MSEEKEEKKTILGEILDWIYCIALAVIITLLVKNLFFSTTIVRQESMIPTLQDGNILFVNRLSQVVRNPLERGDIVVLEAPIDLAEDSDYATYPEDTWKDKVIKLVKKTLYIKRVIGLPGDRLVVDGREVSVNGEILDEPYINPETYHNFINNNIDIEIPEGYVFCMGDNRDRSKDSRSFGLIPINKIEGKATFRLFPFDKFGKIE